MKLIVLQPRMSYFTGGGELMPIEMIEALLIDPTITQICLVTTKELTGYSQAYTNFKFENKDNYKLKIFELEILPKYSYIYNIEAGVNRARWDLESMMFIKMLNSSKISFLLG